MLNEKMTFKALREAIKKSIKILKIDKKSMTATIGSEKGYWTGGLEFGDENRKRLLENRKDIIIKQYKDFVPIKLIAREYGVTTDTVYKRLKKWGIGKRSGIKFLLGKMLLEGD